jgi:hypothetical protein
MLQIRSRRSPRRPKPLSERVECSNCSSESCESIRSIRRSIGATMVEIFHSLEYDGKGVPGLTLLLGDFEFRVRLILSELW